MTSDELHARVQRFIGGESDEPFEALGLAVARFQIENVEPVARLTRARGSKSSSIDEVPALPTDVFRLRRVAAHPPDQDARLFKTSGTTSGARGEHALRTLATYEAAALAHAPRFLWPEGPPARAIVLAPSSAAVPESSLSFMIDLFIARLGLPAKHLVDPERGLDVDAAVAALEDASPGPVLVMGTAFAYVHLLDRVTQRFALPKGSRAMLTGGFKGRSREVPETELRAGIERELGAIVVGEYGMTELSSQLYEASGVYRAPPWVRVEAADPETLEIRPRGAEGIARIIDLANVDSSVAIQTQDRVIVEEDGGVRLRGRAPGATPRGCSLAMEEILR